MTDLLRLLESGKLEYYIIFGQLLGWLWTVKQWRDAEKGRVEDLRTMIELATEVKNSVKELVDLTKGRRTR